MAFGVTVQFPGRRLMAPDPSIDPAQQDPQATREATKDEILQVLLSYKREAEEARRGGPAGRDEVWEDNWNLYWSHMDYSDKADWQNTDVMPEAPQFVDRWAAAMREALNQPGEWYSIQDPGDPDNDLRPHIKRFMEWLIGRAGTTPDGHPTDFNAIFEDLMKLGAIMSVSATVTWQADTPDGIGRVAVDATDPRQVWLDHTGRGLYRLRTYEIDKHELLRRAQMVDGAGQPIYDIQAISELNRQERMEREEEQETSSGHGQQQSSSREPITIDEWLATVVLEDGTVAADRALIVVANERQIIRGPEQNPFWHQQDWVVYTPMVTVPFSVYGRSYMEDWSSVARAFIELTNLILDGVYTSTLNAYALVPEMLEDPTQLQEGVTPNKAFTLEEGSRAQDFFKEIELGSLPAESITVWQGLKSEMREGAKLSEIALGQVPPKGDITATEVSAVQQSTSALVRSMARTVEARALEPTLTLMFQTGLQHVNFADPRVQQELGPQTAQMLAARRAEFQQRSIKFRVRGISSLVDRQQKLNNLISALNTIGSSDLLAREFFSTYSASQVMEEMLRLYGVDTLDLQPTEREQRIREIIRMQEQMQEQAAAAGGGEGGGQGRGGGERSSDRPGEGGQNPGQPRRVQQDQPGQAQGGR